MLSDQSVNAEASQPAHQADSQPVVQPARQSARWPARQPARWPPSILIINQSSSELPDCVCAGTHRLHQQTTELYTRIISYHITTYSS